MTPKEWLSENPGKDMNDFYVWQRQQGVTHKVPGPEYEYVTLPKKKESRLKDFALKAVIAVVAVLIGFLIYDNYIDKPNPTPYPDIRERKQTIVKPPREKTESEIRRELKIAEVKNPYNYISTSIVRRPAILGKQVVLSGTITNNATLAIFKDFKYEIKFFSKTNTEIGSTYHTIYKSVRPGETITYANEKVSIPNGLNKFKIGKTKTRFVGATGY